MKEFIIAYIREYKNKDELTKEELNEMHHVIQYVEHERLVHLIITIMTACVWLLFLYLYLLFLPFIVPAIILTVVLMCYVMYYCWIENTVQEMYKDYVKFSSGIDCK